jgi:steroid Delta-isomerase
VSLLEQHVENFNNGVRTGDWTPMLALMTEDVELEFVGLPIGPFSGRDAVGDAYRAQPPSDELYVLEDRGDGTAVYAWLQDPARPAGELHLDERDGSISRVRILYEQFSSCTSSFPSQSRLTRRYA